MRWRDIGVASQMPWLVTALAVFLVGCSPATAHTPAQPSATSTASTTPPPTAPSPPPSTPPPPKPAPAPEPPSPSVLPVAPGAGRLKQTQAFPSTKTSAFRD